MKRICVQSESALNRMCEQVAKHEEISIDYETRPGWWATKPPLAGIGMAVHEGNGYTAWYVPTGHDIGLIDRQNMPEGLVLSKVKPLLENQKIRKVAHGGEVESGLSKMYGIEIGDSIRCSQLVTWLYDEETWLSHPRQLRLKEIVPVLLGRPIKTVEEHMGGKVKDYGTIPIDVMTLYNTDDSIHALMLHEWCEPELKRQGLWNDYIEIEVPLIRILRDMVIRGVQIDMGEVHRQLDDVQARQQALEGLIYKEAGRQFNVNSRDTLAGIIIEEMGYPEMQVQTGYDAVTRHPIMGPYRTPGGKYKTDDLAMKHYAALGCPIAKFYTEYGDLEKKRGTDLMKFVDGVDTRGIFHPTFWQAGTKTGRYSGNLQQVPRGIFFFCPKCGRFADGTVQKNEKGLEIYTCSCGAKHPTDELYKRKKFVDIRSLIVARPGHWLIKCVAPDSLIPTADLRWIKASDVRKGDDLIAFDEELGRRNRYRRSRVESVDTLIKDCYRIVTDYGEVICSFDHSWVVRRHRVGRKASQTSAAVRMWVAASQLVVGDEIPLFAEPWEEDHSFESGYLAGFFDGEGWCAGCTLGFGQKEGATERHVRMLLRDKGFRTGKTSRHESGDGWVIKTYLKGDKAGLRFLGRMRPKRLLAKSADLWEGRKTWSKTSRVARILRIEHIGEAPVVAIKTSTRTLIVNGLFSHNCDYNQMQLRLLAHYSQDPILLENYRTGGDLHASTAEAIEDSRDTGKTTNFALAFGFTYFSLADQLGEEKAQRVWPLLRGRFKVLLKFTNAVYAYVHETEFVRTLSNRKRRTPYINSGSRYERGHQERQAFNAMCGQGPEADIVKMAQRNLDRAVPEFRQVLQNHDEIVGEFEGTREQAEQVARAVKEVMESVVQLSVPLKADPLVCKTWRGK